MNYRSLPLFIAFLYFCLFPTVAPSEDATGAQWHYSKLDLTVSIHPSTGGLQIVGDGELESSGDATSDLRLHVNGDWYTLKFESVSVQGAAVETNLTDSSHKAWRISSAHFSQPVKPGSKVAIHFTLSKDRDSFPLALTPDVAVAISDAIWYPVPVEGSADLPSGTMIFRMPHDWHAASMGKLASSEQNGEETVETYNAPASRRRAFIAAPYKVRQSDSPTGSNVLYLLNAPVDGVHLLGDFDKGRKFLEARYGPVPFRDYRIAEMPNDAVPWYGASEPGLIISRNEMMLSEEGLLGNLEHELAHSWWGNKVAPQGLGGLLLNEGMAAFSGMAFFEEGFGRQNAIEGSEFGSLSGSPDATIYGYMQLWRAGKDVAISQLKDHNGDHYNIAQSKGVWFLRMLSDRIGKDRFYATLRQIIVSDPSLTLSAFREAMIKAAPDDDGLPQFFAQWLDQPGIPVLDVRWRNETHDDKTRATVSIFQEQTGSPYTLHLDVKLRTRKGIMTRAIDVQGVESRLEFDVPGELVGIELDPNHKVLIWRPEFGQPPPSAY
jgi:hypothetical protein